MPDLVGGLAFYLVFVLSTSCHEAAHAWAALRGGDPTAYAGGQVSLDPMPHIRREPFGMVIFPLLSVLVSGWPLGFASAPYDPHWAERHPRRAAWMALAGPGANFSLVLLTGVLINLGLFAGVFRAPDQIGFAEVTEAVAGGASVWKPTGSFLSSFFSMNLLLGIFNLLPVPPLDGSGAIMLLMSNRTRSVYQRFLWDNPHLAIVGMIAAWWVLSPVFGSVFRLALNVLYVFTGVTYG